MRMNEGERANRGGDVKEVTRRDIKIIETINSYNEN